MTAIKDLLLGSKKVVGLDIGSSLIKLVEIDDTSQGYVLKNYAQAQIPKGVIEDGLVQDATVLSERIKELFKRSKSRTKTLLPLFQATP